MKDEKAGNVKVGYNVLWEGTSPPLCLHLQYNSIKVMWNAKQKASGNPNLASKPETNRWLALSELVLPRVCFMLRKLWKRHSSSKVAHLDHIQKRDHVPAHASSLPDHRPHFGDVSWERRHAPNQIFTWTALLKSRGANGTEQSLNEPVGIFSLSDKTLLRHGKWIWTQDYSCGFPQPWFNCCLSGHL